VLDASDREPEEPVDLSHPAGVAAGQIVVDRDDVYAAARQGVQVNGHRRDEGLAFPRLHLRDLALIENHAADALNVEWAHSESSHGCLAGDGERLGQEL